MLKYQKNFPKSNLFEVSNAGHWVHAENPNEFLEETIKFFKILKVGHLCKKTYFCDLILDLNMKVSRKDIDKLNSVLTIEIDKK